MIQDIANALQQAESVQKAVRRISWTMLLCTIILSVSIIRTARVNKTGQQTVSTLGTATTFAVPETGILTMLVETQDTSIASKAAVHAFFSENLDLKERPAAESKAERNERLFKVARIRNSGRNFNQITFQCPAAEAFRIKNSGITEIKNAGSIRSIDLHFSGDIADSTKQRLYKQAVARAEKFALTLLPDANGFPLKIKSVKEKAFRSEPMFPETENTGMLPVNHVTLTLEVAFSRIR